MVTADGTYATQSALLPNTNFQFSINNEKLLLRKTLLDGDFFMAAALTTDLEKLVFRYSELEKNGISFKFIK